MCGIAGIVGAGATIEQLEKMVDQQEHRGPDFKGTYLDPGFAALGHNRLSIIDPSPAANQPFSDPSGRYLLSFNGEIYNYKELRQELAASYPFRTRSDTEVLLAAYLQWGNTCLHRFKGMFSFALWDQKDKKLFAARDRFGVKPFYYACQDQHFYFSSEIKALRALSSNYQPNPKTWANYLAYGSYGLPEESFYQGIHQLPGGHFLEFNQGKLQLRQWYDFPSRVSQLNTSQHIKDSREHYFQLLKESIALRFRADVPVGFNLSGGVDSSLLLALVNQFEDKKNITAFTFYTGDSRYDEVPWVEAMIANTKNPLRKIHFPVEHVRETVEFISRIQEEPFGGIPTLAYAALFKQAQQEGVKVLLDGQGMDEQWAGYDYYLSNTQATIQGTGHRTPFRPQVLDPDFLALARPPEYPEPFDNSLQNLQYRDLFFTKIPRALRFNDRVSMAYSTELREPFLDHELVEFAFSRPREQKISNGIGKHQIRKLLSQLAPAELSYAPKRPLQTPQREWLGEELRDFTETYLNRLKQSSGACWFDFERLEHEWQGYQKGSKKTSFHIWQWISAGMLLD